MPEAVVFLCRLFWTCANVWLAWIFAAWGVHYLASLTPWVTEPAALDPAFVAYGCMTAFFHCVLAALKVWIDDDV